MVASMLTTILEMKDLENQKEPGEVEDDHGGQHHHHQQHLYQHHVDHHLGNERP